MDWALGDIPYVASIVTVVGGLVAVARWLYGRFAASYHSRNEASPASFTRGDFAFDSTMSRPSAFPIEVQHAGSEASAEAGSVVAGEHLVVLLQDEETREDHVDVWLTVENRGSKLIRWFAPEVTCYPDYAKLSADPSGDPPGHYLYDVYPGKQITAYYRFTMQPPEARLPKYMTCKSWDRDLTFWWGRGA